MAIWLYTINCIDSLFIVKSAMTRECDQLLNLRKAIRVSLTQMTGSLLHTYSLDSQY